MSVRRLLVLGAGPAQLGVLEAAARRDDLLVIAVDRDPAAPGLALAHERAIVSSEDEVAIERLARARDVAGIISPGADWPVGIAARIAERLGTAHPIDARTAQVATSKERQRERFAAARVPHAWSVDPSAPGGVVFPCVVKAADRQGQRGLAVVTRVDELEVALEHARAESRSGAVLVEELIDGPEVTVDGFSLDGVFVPLAVTDRVTAEPPAFGVALAHVAPATAPGSERAAAVAATAVAAVGIEHGPSYTQLRLGPDGPVVMEVAARVGGGHDAELVQLATGVDLNALAVSAALGEDIDLATASPTVARPAAVAFLVPPEGRLAAVTAVDEAAAMPGVEWVRVYRHPGHVFGPLRRGADRAGAVLATGATPAEALARARAAAAAVRLVVDADG